MYLRTIRCGIYITPHLASQHHIEMALRVGYCFTFNNYTDELVDKIKDWITENCKYGCFQKEVAPTTGTPHLQGYINLKKQQRMTTLQKKFGKMGLPLALINANGSPQANRTYCSKEGGNEFWEVGNINIVGQGTRNDLAEPIRKIKEKRSLNEVASEYSEAWVRHYRGFTSLYNILDEQPVEREMDVVLFFGDAGTGKSTKARSYAKLYGEHFTLGVPSGGTVWFDGYNGEVTLLIDEFKGWIQPTFLNQLLDKYKLKLPVKGGFVNAKFTHVFITSNFPPEEWWSDKVIWNKGSLLRRITAIYEFRGNDYSDCTIKKLK